jgi:hypothetical protein
MKNRHPKSSLLLSCAALACLCAGCALDPADQASARDRGEAVYVTGSNLPNHHGAGAVSSVSKEEIDREGGSILTPAMPMPRPGGMN